MPRLTKSKKEYQERIHIAIDYINKHLSEEINLDKLASEACFSPFHFHRIFTGFLNETPRDFIERLRLETAANQLFTKPNDSITEIAFNCGFSSLSTFSRSFKKHYGISASEFLEKHIEDYHSLNNRQDATKENLKKINISNIQIKVLPPMHIAYAETLNGYGRGLAEAWITLNKYADAHGLVNEDTLLLGIPFDNPGVTPDDKCRYRACITVSKEINLNRGIVRTTDLGGGKYALLHFKGRAEEISLAYAAFYGIWLPNSGYIPSDKPLLEIYQLEQRFKANPESIEYDIALPIEPL